MNSAEAIRLVIDSGQMISLAYLGDLTDAEILHRPHPGCNHITWQMGHLIASEHQMIEGVVPGSMPDLPGGFAEKYTKETAALDDAAAFHSKQELMELFEQIRAATLAALAQISDDDLDKASPEEMHGYAPTVGAAFSLQGGHWLMHAGQWAVIRRQLGREPLF
jgi:hypothetical protein